MSIRIFKIKKKVKPHGKFKIKNAKARIAAILFGILKIRQIRKV